MGSKWGIAMILRCIFKGLCGISMGSYVDVNLKCWIEPRFVDMFMVNVVSKQWMEWVPNFQNPNQLNLVSMFDRFIVDRS